MKEILEKELLLKTTDDILIQMCTEAYIGEKINSFLSCYKLMFIRDYVSISLPSNEELMELAVKKDDSILDGLIELCQATLKGMDCYPNEVSIESLMEKNTLWGYYVYNRLFQLEDELGSIENEDIYKDSLKKIKIFLNRALIAIKTSKAKKEKEDKDYQKHRDYWNTRYFLASSSYIDRAKLSFLHVNASSGAKLKFAYDDDFSPLKEMYKETPLSFDVSNLPSNESYAKKLLTESSYNEVYAEAQELESAIYAYNEMIRYSDRDLSDSIDPITEFIKIHHPSLYESFDNLIQLKNKIRFELVEDPLKTPPKSFDNTSYFLPKTSAIFENELSNCNSKAEKEEIYFELLTLIYYAKLKFIAPFSYSPLPNNLENLAQNHDYKALESIEKKVSQLFPSMESGSAIDRIMEIFDYKLYDEIHQLSLLRSKLEQEWKEDSINKPDSSSINKKKTQLDPTILSIIFSIIFFLGLGLGIHLFLGNTITSSNSSQERKESLESNSSQERKESLKETVITSERSQESQTSPKDLFAGKYKTNYIMKVRAQPNYEGNQIGRKEEGVTFEITKSVEGPNNSIWGQLPEGGWICLKDADLVYTTKIGS